ncbi:hypothetical protein [Hymenobacter sp. NBH84]|uniref:hypothetical protein n=1 Tax=Hymenobacter sp. NBH84 TaxID=2596915 RepID=UPI0016282F1E|nr:hypothetical protein [Hymenobacter sp. NBH84]
MNTTDIKSLLLSKGYSQTYIKNNEWKYHFLITNIIHKQRRTTLDYGWVVLNIERMRKVLGNSKINGKPFQFIDKVREDLAEWNIIKYKYIQQRQVNSYGEIEIRNKALAKIKDEAVEQGWKQWDTKAQVVTEVNPEDEGLEKLPGVYGKLKSSLSLLKLDYEGAKAFADRALQTRMKVRDRIKGWRQEKNRRITPEIYSRWLTTLDSLRDAIQDPKRFCVHIEKEDKGRAYTIMTSLPHYFRQFVTLNGEPMVVADISCSQPLLFGLYLKQAYKELTPDMEHYLQLVQSGEFYGYIKSLLIHHNQKFSPDTFKAEFFGKVFYSKEKKFHKWRCLFHMYFPGVSEAILRVKGAVPYECKGEPQKMTSMLSLLESDIMLQGVAAKLYKAGIKAFVTLHDAIYTTQQHYNQIIETIRAEYAQYDITPNIKN